MKSHSFYVHEAEKHGVEKAVILYNLRFWLEKNKANDKNLHDGYYWTYNSAKAFTVLFPYYTPSKVHRLLAQMEKDGLIVSGNYNKAGYDRTKWYSMPEFSVETIENNHFSLLQNAIFHFCKMDISLLQNGFFRSATPIPDINTDGKPDSKPIKCEAEKLVDLWNENRPSNAQVKASVWIKKVKTRLKTFTSDEIKQAMLFLINDYWYQSNSQVLIKNVIDSDERCAKVLEKSSQPAKTNQGNNNANHQSANSQRKKSSAEQYEDMLKQQFADKYGQPQPTERTVN